VVAALYVEAGGCYAGLDGVELWPVERDARLYAGPWPVVAHPPCARWCALAGLVEYLNAGDDRYRVGADGGCFEAALAAVRAYGGVLEHPAYSLAWKRHALPQPFRYGWTRTFFDAGWVTEIDQAAYGHPARKRTWLYAVGADPPPLDWSSPPVERIVGGFHHCARGDYDSALEARRRVRPRLAAATPVAFRDVLLGIARDAG